MNKIYFSVLVVFLAFFTQAGNAAATETLTIHVENAMDETPVKLGVPFPETALYSPDHVRLLNEKGEEILSQTTVVSTWEPADHSIKWLWVFFFTDESTTYQLEYGENVRREVHPENPLVFKNNQRENGFAEITTGPIKLRVDKGGSGFVDMVQFNNNGDSFNDEHTIVSGIEERGTFMDYIDDAGIDASRAVIHQHFIEKGSGPLHAILRIEGEYEYDEPDHENAPFVTYIHAYAGKSYVRVLHTITYTGIPDKSEPLDGKQHALIATQTEQIVDEEKRAQDKGLLESKDRIQSAGFGLRYHLQENKTFRTGLTTGHWWEDGSPWYYETEVLDQPGFSVFQTGPNPIKTGEVLVSDKDERIGGFTARLESDELIRETEKAEGWISISDHHHGVSVGLKNMMEEYPNELSIDLENVTMNAYSWSPKETPMSFARGSTEPDGGMVGNFARGITKTTELILYVHEGDRDTEDITPIMDLVLDPPVAFADPDWYGQTGVFGRYAGADNSIPALERSMQYKFDWMLFNQNWEPWYGMFHYGDVKNYYFNNTWNQWAGNEPDMDFMWWMNFIRTGDPRYYNMAMAMSRHTMDVDNIHWPRPREYRGDTNPSLDWFLSKQQPEGSPYVGIGDRHAGEQFISKLSAHVWIKGWLASYYLDGYHRGLEVARLTGDYYIRRIFGEHGLTGRRLYLSINNLSEIYDATKEEKYLNELDDRVNRLLNLQSQQGGRMVIDRYGYSQNYLSHGLTKYLQMFDRPDVERALVTHAKNLFYTPPRDHDYESYLSSVHMLITAYDLTKKDFYLEEACNRAKHLLVDEKRRPFSEFSTQGQLADEMERISRLPVAGEGPSFRGRIPIWGFSHGMRIFGWTHAFSVPYLIERLQEDPHMSEWPCVE